MAGRRGCRPNLNPADRSDVIGEYAHASVEQVSDAVAEPNAALPAWANASPQLRSNILEAVASEIFARKEEIGTILAREAGKTLAEAIGENRPRGADLPVLRR